MRVVCQQVLHKPGVALENCVLRHDPKGNDTNRYVYRCEREGRKFVLRLQLVIGRQDKRSKSYIARVLLLFS
jgi:hypothetical protein